MAFDFAIDPDIRRATTMPAAMYTSREAFERQRTHVFARSWQLVPSEVSETTASVVPWTLLPQCLDEPLLLTRDTAGTRRVLSNVCTHRAALLVDEPGSPRTIRCPYHGRRFALDGHMTHAPGFETCAEFPGPTDHLPRLPLAFWGPLAFTGLAPRPSFAEWLAPLQARLGAWLPTAMRHAPEHRRVFRFAANWALYCDNYLEGLHIPFVHPGLKRALARDGYEVELLATGVLQRARAAPGNLHFTWPKSHPDHGEAIAAYYYWLFPTTMINVYPWGMSLNAVLPRAPGETEVVFTRYVWDETHQDEGAGSDLESVEHEDERVVERCYRGLAAATYRGGRYAPEHERGVHHFHRSLCDAMRESP